MSLDWSIDRVHNWKERCYRPSPMRADKGKKRVVLEIDTEALVWGTMVVCIGQIRNSNIDEWDYRIQFLKRLGMSWSGIWDGKKDVDTFPDYDQIADHIGLSTNVIFVARQKWMKQTTRRLEREIEQLQQSQKTKRQEETQ